MGRTVLCFVVGPGWIRYCEKPGISLPSPPYCPAMCEPSSEEADHLSLETGGDRGKSPQNPNDGEVVLYELFQYLIKNCISRIMELKRRPSNQVLLRTSMSTWRVAMSSFGAILAINVVSAFFGKPNRAWSMCEENTAFSRRAVLRHDRRPSHGFIT